MILPRLLCVVAPVLALPTGPQGPPEARFVAPRTWLVLPSIDATGRRPFRPDEVLRRLVLLGEPLPAAGDRWSGETGTAAWESVVPDEGERLPAGSAHAVGEFDLPAAGLWRVRAPGVTRVLVDDVPVAGDRYGYGWPSQPLALAAGRHRVLLSGLRGRPGFSLERVSAELLLDPWDLTVPSLLVGRVGDTLPLEGALPVVRAATTESEVLVLRTGGDPRFREAWSEAFTLPALSMDKRPFPIVPRRGAEAFAAPGTVELSLELVRARDGAVLASLRVPLGVRRAGDVHRRTFRSAIDDSVQEFSLRPPASPAAPEPRLVLSLHGAGVASWNQAASYGALPDFWIVAPTNRRPFGFDWQDWGRRDAYEVLERALDLTGVPRARVSLSGHSMGGHGTWSLAANDPDGFAAIGPSAGWRSFDTYGGRPAGPLAELWHGADLASDTEALIDNLVGVPTYVLHSDADESVPVEEARAMIALLEDHGARPGWHIEPGKGHWWDGDRAAGADCLAWPEFFELFRASEIPADPDRLDFTTVDPGVDADHHWVSVDQPLVYGRHARVRAERRAGEVRLVTENVRRLRLRGLRRAAPAGGDSAFPSLVIDGEGLDLGGGVAAEEVALVFEDRWRLAPAGLPPGEKRPDRSGPLKRAFDRGFVLVVPTRGDALEVRRAGERARRDAAAWWYRGNGRAPIVRDEELLRRPRDFAGRSLILYGNGTINAAWERVLGPDAPLAVERGAVRLRDERFEGEGLGVLACLPRADDARGLVAVLATTGAPSELVAPSLSLFVSGVGYPDYVVFSEDVLRRGDGGVLRAGWWDHRWR